MSLSTTSTPQAARAAYRDGLVAPTSGVARGMTQANLIALPAAAAADFARFAEANPISCPVLEVTDPGALTSALAPGSDLRTDIPAYRVWRDGEVAEERPEVVEAWAETDLVAFLIGCSFTFEFPLLDAGIPIRHLEAGRNVPMYASGIDCVPAGPFHGPMVVSMRGIPESQVELAAQISGRYPSVHGAPVHVGDPAEIGIADLASPEYGDPPVLQPGDVPVFWGCGVTPQAALAASRPAFAITHAPGHMFITDRPDEHYRIDEDPTQQEGSR